MKSLNLKLSLMVIILAAAMLGGLIGSGFTIMSVSAKPKEKIIKANKFVLTNIAGTELATLASNKNGAYLSICDKDGDKLMFLGNLKDGLAIIMENKSRKANLLFVVGDNENDSYIQMHGNESELTLGNSKVKEKINLSTGNTGIGSLAIKDQNGIYRLSVGVGNKPYFVLRNSEEKYVYRIEERQDMAHIKMRALDKDVYVTSEDLIDIYANLKKKGIIGRQD